MNVTVLGCGVFGMSLTSVFLENKNNKIVVWNKFDDDFKDLREKYLNVTFTTDLDSAVKGSDLIVIAIPITYLESVVKDLKEVCRDIDILIASKGIDTNSQLFSYQIINKYFKDINLGVISGGTFASDMQNKKVMGITLATKHESIKNKIKNYFECKFLRVQYIDDIIGVSVCGAIKNVMAIGFGMLDGAGFPPSSKFLFLTEAIYEIRHLIKALGGNVDTILSYAGIDDIMMTCTSNDSRNYTLGSMIGRRESLEKINEYKEKTTIEGLGTSLAMYKLASNNNINLPIVNTIYSILYNNADIIELIKILEKRES